jgi:hypothetical protein
MGFIYLIKLSIFTNSDTIEKVGKIGFTTNLKKRIEQYKNNFPQLLFSKDLGDKANYYEQLLIKKFNEKFEVKQGKEYFQLDEEEMINIIKKIISENYKPKEFYNPLEQNKTKKEDIQIINKIEKYKKIEEFKCLDCNYKSNRKYNLKTHVLRKHKREIKEEECIKIKEIIPLKCLKCNKEFKSKQGLNYHINICKEVSNKLECHYCHKVFSSPSSKCNHLKICRVKKEQENKS